MTRPVRAARLSDQVVREMRTATVTGLAEITATGQIIGTIGIDGHIWITLRCDAEQVVEIHPA